MNELKLHISYNYFEIFNIKIEYTKVCVYFFITKFISYKKLTANNVKLR